MKKLLRIALRAGLRNGWRRGVLQGNRAWTVVGGLALVGHLAGRAVPRREEIVFREQLAPGETFRITHLRES